MPKYHTIVQHIRKLIEDQQLQPGDPLPPERELAKEFGVAYGTIRMANNLLIRDGLIERQQGRGTFVARALPETNKTGREGSEGRPVKRLGLLSVEMGVHESPFLRALTFSLQRHVHDAGYELVIEQLEIEQIVQGKLPRMVRRHSVDGFFVYGRVRQHHIQFLQQQNLPFILIGNRPVNHEVPQVRINAEQMGYQITSELYKLNRSPIWLDADPSNTDYTPGIEFLRGHSQAIAEAQPGALLHLCSVRLHKVEQAVEQMLNADLSNAAFIVQDWAASIVMTSMAMRDPKKFQKLLVVPTPSSELCRQLHGDNILQWDGSHDVENLAEPAVMQLLPVVEGKADAPESLQVEFDVKLVPGDQPRMRCDTRLEPYTPPADADAPAYLSTDMV